MSTLVYLCHFGDEEHGNLMVAAVTALRLVGNYQGDIFIYTDNPDLTNEFVKQMPGREQIAVVPNSGNRGLFTRYSAGYFLSSLYSKYYSNFVYLANDVIAKADLAGFFKTIEESPTKIQCYTKEFFPNYSIRSARVVNPLTIAYPREHSGTVLTLNSSIFAFKPCAEAVTIFEKIRSVRDTTPEYRYNLDYDTALFSYEVYKLNTDADRKYIKPLVNVITERSSNTTDIALFQEFTQYRSVKDKLSAVVKFVDGLLPEDSDAKVLLKTLSVGV